MLPPIMPLWHIDYFARRGFEESTYTHACTHMNSCKQRLSLSASYLPKVRTSKRKKQKQRKLNCHQAPSQEFHPLGKIGSDHKRGNWKLTWHPDKLYHKLLHPPFLLLRAHSSFLKVFVFPYITPPLPLLRWLISSQSLTAVLDITTFSSCDVPVYITLKKIKINKNNKCIYLVFC